MHAPEAAAPHPRIRADEVHTETLGTSRARQAQHFPVSPGAANTEWGGSPSAHGWVNRTGWQDPWTQAADPWTSWNTSWQQQDGHGGWGHTAPLLPAPGAVPPAASEQWTDRTDAKDDRLLSEAVGDRSRKTGAGPQAPTAGMTECGAERIPRVPSTRWTGKT